MFAHQRPSPTNLIPSANSRVAPVSRSVRTQFLSGALNASRRRPPEPDRRFGADDPVWFLNWAHAIKRYQHTALRQCRGHGLSLLGQKVVGQSCSAALNKGAHKKVLHCRMVIFSPVPSSVSHQTEEQKALRNSRLAAIDSSVGGLAVNAGDPGRARDRNRRPILRGSPKRLPFACRAECQAADSLSVGKATPNFHPSSVHSFVSRWPA